MIIGVDGSRAFVSKRTGTENYSYQILLHLSQIDTQNSYLVYIRPSSRVDYKQWPKNFKFITIPYKRLWTQIGLGRQTFKDTLDVLFIPAHTLPLIKRPGLKTVVTVHDLGAEYLPQLHQIKQRLYLNFMTHHQLKSASSLIAVSQATKDDLVRKVGVSKDRINVIYEGYNQNLFHSMNDDILNITLKQFDLVSQGYFLFVGTIQPRKNLERLIKAYAKILDTGLLKTDIPQLVLAGGKGWLSDEIYQLPHQLGIEERVKFLGFVADDNLPTLYSGAKAFLFPSLFEGFGLPVLEAFACGCPVLTSNNSSLPEVAGEAAVLVDPKSIDSIVDGIKTISDKQLAKSLKQKGFEQIKKFSWHKAAQETLKVLTETAHG